MFRNWRWTKEIDYLELNSQGFEGSLKNQAMAENDGGKEMSSVETEPQTNINAVSETDHAGISAPNQLDGDAVEEDTLSAEQEIDNRMEAAAREKKRLSYQIRIQKKLRLLDQLERENQRLQDELSSVTEESDIRCAKSVLRAPYGGERQRSSGSGKLKS